MTPRRRRLIGAGIALVLFLFVGRWAVDILAWRWWAAALGPEAARVVGRWQFNSMLFDGIAVVIASAWFALQALLVARAIALVQIERRIGNEFVREAIPTRLLLLGAVATGVLLGLLTSGGGGSWADPLALAQQDLRYGVTDPLLGEDLGVLAAQLPLWRLLWRFAAMLVGLGLAFSALLYAGIGAMRWRERRIDLHADARRHLGGLLVLLALVIAVGALNVPYLLAVSSQPPLGPISGRVRLLAAHVLVGISIAVAIMSLMWALRGRHSVVTAAWIMLGLAVMIERVVVPAFATEIGLLPAHEAEARRFGGLMYGLRSAEPHVVPDTLPPVALVWDEESLRRWLHSSRTGTPVSVMPIRLPNGRAGWHAALVMSDTSGGVDVRVVADSNDGFGHPVDLGRTSLPDARVHPGAVGWRVVPQGGVRVGGALRRLALAWALQAPAVAALSADQRIDWALEPDERLRRLAPGVDWLVTGFVVESGSLRWVASGVRTVEAMPLSTRVPWGDRTVAGIVPSLIGVVDAVTGHAELFHDPAGDSLGTAWARATGDLVQPARAVPLTVVEAVGYPAVWLRSQLQMLEATTWGLGIRPGRRTPEGPPESPTTIWHDGGPARQAVFEDPARRTLSTVATAFRQGRVPVIRFDETELPTPANGRELERIWGGQLGVSQLSDSSRAAGDSLIAGPVRWYHGAAGLVAWQSFVTQGRRGIPALLWFAAAHGEQVVGARRPHDAWGTLKGGGEDRVVRTTDDPVRLEAVRAWLRRADSALSRGDLTAFGRAWEALRGLMLETPE